MNQSPTPGGGFDFDALMSWALLIGLSLLGGWASFVRKMKDGHVRAWNVTEFVGELVVSGFTGIVVANLCDYINAPVSLKYALVGIMAHMGSPALVNLESLANAKFGLAPDARRSRNESRRPEAVRRLPITDP